MSGRGQLTPGITELAKSLGFPDFTVDHLRLLPYVQYLAMNHSRLDPAVMGPNDRGIISDWRKAGWLAGGASEPISLNLQFWDMMNPILWASYVNQMDPTD